jgi:hypothetical protein
MPLWLGREATFGPRLVERALTVSPLAAALAVMDVPSFRDYHLVPAGWWLVGVATLTCFLFLHLRVWQMTRPR